MYDKFLKMFLFDCKNNFEWGRSRLNYIQEICNPTYHAHYRSQTTTVTKTPPLKTQHNTSLFSMAKNTTIS